MDRSELPLPYAYSSLLHSARLTRLSIEGLGSINLPLSKTDAKRMVAFASGARFAQANQTIANKGVQNKLGLGLITYDTPPRCKLSKLLVSEKGSG
jgi:hypothetical protein